MVNYSCTICEKVFTQKGHFEAHQNRKRPCKKDNTIEALVTQKVQEVLSKTVMDPLSEPEAQIATTAKPPVVDYTNKTREELIVICKEQGIKGYSNKRKEDILRLLTPPSDTETKNVVIVPEETSNVVIVPEETANVVIVPEEVPSIDTGHILKVGTLFSGIGAFEHALQRLKIPHKIAFACDINPQVKTSYFENYTIEEKDWYEDVIKLDAKKYLKDKIDVVVGGSPCQSFSFVGKQKGLEDDRGNLIFQFIRVVNESKPKIFLFENVKGLTTHDKGETFKKVLAKFRELDYDLQYDILKATDYGIPQSRQRLFLLGIRKGSNVTAVFPPKKLDLKLKMADLLEDNVNTKYYLQEKGQHFAVSDKNLAKKYTQINGEIALCQKKNQQFNWHGDFVFEYRDIPEKYYLSEKVRHYVLQSGTKDFKSKPETDLDIARPLLSSMHKMHRAGVDNYVTAYGKLRKLTPRECLRLMGFADTFKIIVSDTQMYQQAGNSIVVNILMEIIKNIRNLY